MATVGTQEVGKIHGPVFDRVIRPRLGAVRREVSVGPHSGLDAGIVELGCGRVMAITTDPFYVLPDYGLEAAGWFAVQIVASDAATTGLAPQYLAADLNLPVALTDGELEAIWTGVDSACRELGIAIVTGHTGRYEGCGFPILGGLTAVCVGEAGAFITPRMARVGDRVLLTKCPALEAVATFGVLFEDHITEQLGADTAISARKRFWEMSVVRDALTASAIGVRDNGVTTMHDATERGVWGAVHEVAAASEVGMKIDQDAIPLPADIDEVCRLFDIDPFTSSSEGTLLLTVVPSKVDLVLETLREAAVPANLIGIVTVVDEGVKVTSAGVTRDLPVPTGDPFWPALTRARGQPAGS